MANSVQKIVDSNKKLVIKLWGDAAEPAPVLKIDGGALAFALNANGRILGANTDRKSIYRMDLLKVVYDVQSGDSRGYVRLSWNGDNPNTLITLSGSGDLSFEEGGSIFSVNNSAVANSTGNLSLQTVGFSNNCAYSIFAVFKKNPGDYDQGQTASPRDFNV